MRFLSSTKPKKSELFYIGVYNDPRALYTKQKQVFIYSLATLSIEKNMSDHNNDTFGECDNCQLETRLYGGICENCDDEYFAEFWTGEVE